MKKAIIITLLFSFGVLQTMAQKAVVPKITFEETTFNFDTIMQNGNGEHVFRFTNTGDAPLLITSAFSSCGCVVPEWPKEPIAPQASGSIKVKYNTSKLGLFTKVIVVKSNDKETPKTILRLNGIVVEAKEKKQTQNETKPVK